MHLVSVRIAGYKRFEAPATLWVTSPLIAIVGPNEAGKTSLLEAMHHLSHSARFVRTEYTDRREPETDDAIVAARYTVEPADRQAAGGLLDDETEYVLTVQKGPIATQATWSLSPRLHRDLTPRGEIVEDLRRVVVDELLVERTSATDGSEDEDVNTELSEEANSLANRLEAADEDLTSTALKTVEEFVTALRERYAEEPPPPISRLAGRLDRLYAHENEENPHNRMGKLLAGRRPVFLFFTGPHRTLQTNYEWAEHETPPTALGNLCHLAAVNYETYRETAMDRERRDELQTLERAANAALEREFESWTQAQLSVEFRADPQGLQVQVVDKKTLRNVPFDQRSAGLRQFVALVAFTIRYKGFRPPVLLIDEAEMHLHYGGQADLIQVFERQTVAQAIIYSTHSIGCLPEDLGTTIRVAEPTEPERTVLRDSFWEGGAGLTPLVLAMGATALAFTPSRFAVIGEGPSEAILLPSLFREARDEKYAAKALGFQVAPGLAHVARNAAAELEFDAGNVAYVHDADAGGRDHADKLPHRARQESRVIELGDGTEQGLCLEDFIEQELYADAVNSVLARTRETEERVEPSQMPDVARPSYLAEWCEQRGLVELSKRRIAEDVLRRAREPGRHRLVEPARRVQLSELYERLRKVLKVPGWD